MDNFQFKNLRDCDKDRAINRVLPIERLMEMIQKKQLIMPQINHWEDPYENFFLRSEVYQDGEKVDLYGESELLFGQCWSLAEENDTMWRIYSPDRKSVLIKTTINKLFNQIQRSGLIENESNIGLLTDKYIGKVEYITQNEFNEWRDTQVYSGNLTDNIIDSLYLKREYFRHEEEIRVIYLADNEDSNFTDSSKNLIKLSIEPFDFIEEIKFDPRVDKSFYETYSNLLSEKFKFPQNRITRSTIYDFYPLIIRLK